MRCSVNFIASAKLCRKFTVNPPALFWSAKLGENAKFLDTLIYKNNFWVQRGGWLKMKGAEFLEILLHCLEGVKLAEMRDSQKP